MTGSEATMIKTGAMVASGGFVADLIIFNDPMYGTLAVSGAVVSLLGVVHEITENRANHNMFTITGEIIKGATLGFIAIPFWYLLLSGFGGDIIVKQIGLENGVKIEKSIWLLVSFWLAWFTVPIIDFFVRTAKKISKGFNKNDAK